MKEQKMKIEYVPLDSVKMYERNAKLHPEHQVEQIKKSITDYGMRDPIGIWKDEIVEGHGRWLACKELGLVHNKTNMNSGFDFALLDEELGELPDFDAEMYGFTAGIDEYVDGFFEDGVQAKEKSVVYGVKVICGTKEQVDECMSILKEAGYSPEEL